MGAQRFYNFTIPQNQKKVNHETRYSIADAGGLKEKQFCIIRNANPMHDDYHAGVCDIKDIKTFTEAMEEESFTPDYTEQIAQDALRTGTKKPVEFFCAVCYTGMEEKYHRKTGE